MPAADEERGRAGPPKLERARGLPDRFWRFWTQGLWTASVETMPRHRAWRYRTARVLYGGVSGFFANQLTVRAAALTYYTVLSIVPFLAFAFAVVKGLGAYRILRAEVISPWVLANFGENPALVRAIDQVLEFVERTEVSSLGVAGLVFLVYTVVALLSSIEATLNELWGVKRGRALLRQVTDYITMVVIAPILILTAVTFATAAQSSRIMTFLRDTLALGFVIDFVLRFTSLAVAILAMTVMFLIMPNTRTRVASAVLGGVVAGVLWQAALYLAVQAQVGVARYNALYSGFAAVPLFIFWLYVSWTVVLIGAQIAAAHQNERVVRQQMRARYLDQATREALAVAATARVAQGFVEGNPRWSGSALAEALDVPMQVLDDVLGRLTRHHVLARIGNGNGSGKEPAYLPARDIDQLRVKDVLDAVKYRAEAVPRLLQLEPRLGAAVERLMAGINAELAASEWNFTLRQLGHMSSAQTTPEGAGAEEPREAPERAEERPPAHH